MNLAAIDVLLWAILSLSINLHLTYSELTVVEAGFRNSKYYTIPEGLWEKPYGYIDIYGCHFLNIYFSFRSTSGTMKTFLHLLADWEYNRISKFKTMSNQTQTELPDEFRNIFTCNSFYPFWVALHADNVMFGRGRVLYEDIIVNASEPNIEPGDFFQKLTISTISVENFGFLVYTREQLETVPKTNISPGFINGDIRKAFDGNIIEELRIGSSLSIMQDLVISIDVNGTFPERYLHFYVTADKTCDIFQGSVMYPADNEKGLGESTFCDLVFDYRYKQQKRCTYRCYCEDSSCGYVVIRIFLSHILVFNELEIY